MVDEARPESPPDAESPEKEKRDRSRIEFPYSDLHSSVGLVETLILQGGGTASEEQLAVWLDQTVSGGTFRSRLSAARMFGLIEGPNSGLKATGLGRRSADPAEKAAALPEAFLRMPLYRIMYEKLKGYALPPSAAIERQMVIAGVIEKQKDRARQAFVKSAGTAGFIDPSSGRFIQPGNAQLPPPRRDEPPEDSNVKPSGGGNGNGTTPGLHPFIAGLLTTLPDPDTEWPVRDRAKWLSTAASIFGLIYKGEGEISVQMQAAIGVPATAG